MKDRVLLGAHSGWWALLAFAVLVFALDVLQYQVVYLALYVVVVTASAIGGRPVATGSVAVAVLTLAWLGALSNDLAAADIWRRVLVIALVGVMATVLAREVARARREVREERDRYLLLAENASDVVYRASGDRRVTWISPSVTAVLEWSPRDLVGTSIVDLVHPEDAEAMHEICDRVFAGESVADPSGGFLARLRSRSGEYVWMAAKVTRIVDQNQAPVGVVGGFAVVDELVSARKLAELRGELLRVNSDAALDPQVLMRAVRDDYGQVVDFTFLDVNRATCDYLAMQRVDLIGSRLLTALPGLADSGLLRLYVDAIESGEPTVADGFSYTSGVLGDTRFYDVRARRVSGDRLSLTWRDVTDRFESNARIEQSEEHFRLLAENSTDVVGHARDGKITWISPSITAVLGGAPEDWIGRDLAEVLHPDDIPRRVNSLGWSGTDIAGVMRVRVRGVDGAFHWVEANTGPFVNSSGQVDGVIASFRVIDELVRVEQELQYRARFDALTGLMNRKEILERLAAMAGSVRQPGEHTAVLFCDIDKFKDINDTHGHAGGDQVLRILAARIGATVRSGDTAARIGGDEILVILPGVHSLDEAAGIAEKIRDAASAPISVDDGRASTTLSIGVTLLHPSESIDGLVARADRAMYEAKRQGRDRIITLR